ncbi:MAG: hypothetical protein K2N51_09510 [Lachnospiraceae bacterium]|nr:hypothetical protein [Lachnospiraceae bacterium]
MDWKKFLKEYKEHFQKAKEEDAESINQIEIDFEKEILVINGKEVKEPVIVSMPLDSEWQRRKIFNLKKGCCRKEKLPEISITLEGDVLK